MRIFTGHILLFRLLLKPCSIIAGHITMQLLHTYFTLDIELINPSSQKLSFALTDQLLSSHSGYLFHSKFKKTLNKLLLILPH